MIIDTDMIRRNANYILVKTGVPPFAVTQRREKLDIKLREIEEIAANTEADIMLAVAVSVAPGAHRETQDIAACCDKIDVIIADLNAAVERSSRALGLIKPEKEEDNG
jgi:hypothetical protein